MNKNIKAKLLKFFTRKKVTKFNFKNTKKILFLRYDRIGDMIITTPVFRELKVSMPEINISVLASKINQSVIINNPYIDNIYLNNKNFFLKDIYILLQLRKENFDVCVEFDHSVVPHAIIKLLIIKPKVIISVFKDGRYGVKGEDLDLYDYFTEKSKNQHLRDIWLKTLLPLGLKASSNHYDLFHSDHQNQRAIKFLRNYQEDTLLGINLEGAVDGKKINYDDLERLCKGIFEYHKDIKIIILSTPNKFESVKEKILTMQLDYVLMSYKTDSILDVSALIEKLELIITPDTSVVHIASTFNKPLVTIHENNKDSYNLFAPTSDLHRTVFSKSKNSLNNYSLGDVIDYSIELINLIKGNYE